MVAVGAVPVVLGAIGFTSSGIAASSIAAKMMSSAAIANGGGVAAGSLVATLQSVGRCPEQEEGGVKGRNRARMGFSPEPQSLVLCLPSTIPSFVLRGVGARVQSSRYAFSGNPTKSGNTSIPQF